MGRGGGENCLPTPAEMMMICCFDGSEKKREKGEKKDSGKASLGA